ncbi:hypothetical protein DTL21_06990 [Bremerella cremea]|uniref:Uncharacterized protein n=1 Tax=Blastopirellula marina TaxID=124 RepID=A0A2S8G0L6_9BACT|nr:MULTISPECIES: hypothetical protein [Pirellulaceae]PQO37684.1 hypothetical protein C5Y83_06990 [Blastopirellula marina]RCS50071.1 hypothetical protein DTL21_06990 [Bremerella cremea]
MSARDHILQRLPDPNTLERRLQSLAVLTEILSWDLGEPRVSFDATWRKNARQALIDNYQGDRAVFAFTESGTLVEGSVHDCPLIRDKNRCKLQRINTPSILRSYVDEGLIENNRVTFNAWYLHADLEWSFGAELPTQGDDTDGAELLLFLVVGDAEGFQTWAEENYEQDFDLSPIKQIFDHVPLTNPLVRQLNVAVSLREVASTIRKTGYPIASE